MKKCILFVSFFGCIILANAQTNTFPVSGNTGIGTLTPAAELEVKGTIITDTLLFPDGTKQATAFPSNPKFLNVGDSSITITGKSIIRDDGELRIQSADTVIQQTSFCVICPSHDTTIFFSPNNFNTVINAGNTGKVGIGTFSPTEKLTVQGTIQSTSGGFKFPDGSVQTTAGVQQNSSAVFSILQVNNLAGVGDRMLAADASGNLKTLGPLSALSWQTSGNGGLNSSADFLGTTDNVDLVIRTNSIERLRVKTNGRIGIGTNNPLSTLHILGIDPAQCPVGLRLEYQYTGSVFNGCTTTSTWDIKNSGNGTLDFSTPAISTPVMTMINSSGTGVVGIGDPLPGAGYEVPNGRLKLDVRGDGRFTSTTNAADYVRLGFNTANAIIDNFGTGDLLINYYSGKNVGIGGGPNGPSDLSVSGNTTVNEHAGIGTPADPAYNFKVSAVNPLDKALAVFNGANENFLVYGDGFCFARRFEVATGAFTHPDYVFKKGYPLRTIEQLAAFIEKEGHHPNFLSAKEYEKKGKYDLLEMDMNLLKTSEELTLYTVQQQDEIDKLKQIVTKQNDAIELLKKEITELKRK